MKTDPKEALVKIEKLNLFNVFEVQQIKKLLEDKPELVLMLEIMVRICNQCVNKKD
jgi:hypothetical protein